MATPRKKAALFRTKTSCLKGNNVITKYFFSKCSEEDSLSGKLYACSNALKTHNKKEKHTKPNYRLVKDTIILLDSDDADEQEMNQKVELQKDSKQNGVSATLSTVISSVMPIEVADEMRDEKHNVLSAFDSNLNTTNERRSNLSERFVKTNLSSPCKNLSSQSSRPTKTDSPRSQTNSPRRIEKDKSIAGVKRKQLTLDTCFDAKKRKREAKHKNRSFSQPSLSVFGQQTANGALLQKTFSNVVSSSPENTIVDLTVDNIDRKEDCTKNGLLNKSGVVDLTADDFSSLRKISSDSEIKSAEYETGYDSMTENTKTHVSDNLTDMYSLFEDTVPKDSVADESVFSNDDVFPVYSNNPKEHSLCTPNSPLSKKICLGNCRKSNISCCSSASSTDRGICSDDETSLLDLMDTNQSPLESNFTFPVEESIAKELSYNEDIPETKGSQTETAFNTRRLDRILKDKKENETLKLMEDDLLNYVKNGGFSRFINESSDEECDHDKNEDYSSLERMIISTEDCQGLDERHKSVRIFSRKRLYFFYCPHNITAGETILPYFLRGLDLRAQLNFVNKNAKLIEQYISSNHQDEDEETKPQTRHVAEKITSLMEWLLQVLATNTDVSNLELAETAFLSLLNSSNLEMNSAQTFYTAIANLGIRKKYCVLNGFRQEKPPTCKECKANAIHSFSPFRRLPFILRVLRRFLTRHPNAPSDVELRHLVVLFTLLLSETHQDADLHNLVSGLLVKVLQAIRGWEIERFMIVQDVVNATNDIHTLYHIVSVLSTTSQRSVELRRCIALVLLRKHVEGMEIQQQQDGMDANNVEVIESLASKLTVDNVELALKKNNDDVTKLTVYNTMWFCVLLLQSCVGDVNVKCKENLEGITQSFRSLNLDIKENGCLYCSEIKHHIRLTTAVAEIRLHEMPKSQTYQKEIFKYLRAAKVKEEIVDVVDDTDSEIDDNDSKTADTDSETDSVTSFYKRDDTYQERQSLFEQLSPLSANELLVDVTQNPANDDIETASSRDITSENAAFPIHECPLRLKQCSSLQAEVQTLTLPSTPHVANNDLTANFKEQVEFLKLLHLSPSNKAHKRFFEQSDREPVIKH